MEGVLSGVLWGRLASVRRTLAWATLAAEQGKASRYVGTTCARLLDEVLVADALSAEVVAGITAARDALQRVDGLPEQERRSALIAAGAALEAAVPLAQAGAGLVPEEPLQARVKFVLPEDRVEADLPVAKAAPVPRPPAVRPPAARLDPGLARPEPRAPLPPPPEPVDARLPLGHPDGTGAAPGSLPGVSDGLVAALDSAGLSTVADLLLTAPVSFDRPPLLALEDPEVVGTVGVVRGRICSRALRFLPASAQLPSRRAVEIRLVTPHQQQVLCRWWGAPPRRTDRWQLGAEVAVVGLLRAGERGFLIEDGEPVGVDGRGSGWLPQYGIDGVDDAELRDLVAVALGTTLGALRDPLPDDMLTAHRLLPLDEALRDAHFPANAAGRGRARMAFEELLLLQLALTRRVGLGPGERGQIHKALHNHVGQLQVQFDLTLNDEAELAFSQIRRDLQRPWPMARVLEGDVGTAKGLVALLAAVLVVDNRAQVAFVSGDPTMAERQYLFAEGMLRSIGIKPLLVADAPSHAAADAIRRGEANVVFCTPNLVTGDVEWRRLGLVVATEQQEFGILQPHQLESRGPRPDLLVVAAGPIPPLLLLSGYAAFEVSTIRRTEPVRVACRVFPSAERRAAYECVRGLVSGGRQALVAFPVRSGQDVLGREDAERVGQALGSDLLPGVRIGVYSSDMNRDERGRVFEDFRHRRIDVLIVTTPIEDGPPVPACGAVVVEHADRSDLIRLHRLRGHVGHGQTPGHCFFVLSDNPTPEGLRVVERAAAESARLELSDEDLNAPGGPRTSAALRNLEPPALAWAEMPRDREILLNTRALAHQILREDNALRRYPAFRRLISERWPGLLAEPERGQPHADAGAGAARKRRRRRRRR